MHMGTRITAEVVQPLMEATRLGLLGSWRLAPFLASLVSELRPTRGHGSVKIKRPQKGSTGAGGSGYEDAPICSILIS